MGIHCSVCGRPLERIRSSRDTCSAKCRKRKSRNAGILNRVKLLQKAGKAYHKPPTSKF